MAKRHALNIVELFEAGVKFGCDPPTVASKKVPRFFLSKGTVCRITPVSKIEWKNYVTKIDLGFDKFERYVKESKRYEFRYQGWIIQVWRKFVKHREDEPGYGV